LKVERKEKEKDNAEAQRTQRGGKKEGTDLKSVP
jgi:hypothetical protein